VYTHRHPIPHRADTNIPINAHLHVTNDNALQAVGDGVVHEVKDNETVEGIHVGNLFKWNSVMLKLNDGNYVE
jgi:hypothetical protein